MDEESSESVYEEDYYAFLNVSKTASAEEIREAYRRLSKLYHPDKHTDEKLKKDAELMFNRTKQAYEVLIDPQKRAIYDYFGTRGLETSGWEVVARTKTPQELREEYERLEREREERKLEMATHPKCSVTVNINASDLFSTYADEFSDSGSSIFSSLEISSMSLVQSIQAPMTTKDTAILQGELRTKNGVGSGSMGFSFRHVLSSNGWFEIGAGAGNGPNLSVKVYRSLTRRIFFNAATIFQFNPNEIRPALVGTAGMQLDTHTVGYLTWRGGSGSGMNTTIVRGTPQSYTALSIEFSLMESYIKLSYTYKIEQKELRLRGCIKVGTFGTFAEYGLEKKVSKHSSLSTTVHVGIPTGVILRIKLTRSYQTYNFPIFLSEEILPAPVFYATVAPLFTWAVIKNLIIDPIIKNKREQNKDVNKKAMAEKQKEAKAAIDLMRATFSRIRSEEERKLGLVITKALYGRFVYPQDSSSESSNSGSQRDEIIDVTIPLQCLVKDSKLVLHNASKKDLPGFYDPCPGESKQLLVQYLFHEQSHECLIKDNEPLRIPKQTHRVNAT